jgi:hypothetical protein
VAGQLAYDFESAVGVATRPRSNALFVLTSAVIFRDRTQRAQLALKHWLPTSFAHGEHAEAGGLMGFGANMPDTYELVADRVNKILGMPDVHRYAFKGLCPKQKRCLSECPGG